MTPLAPGLFSTITRLPKIFAAPSASVRRATSVVPPAVKGQNTVMGRSGKASACARARGESASAAGASTSARRRRETRVTVGSCKEGRMEYRSKSKQKRRQLAALESRLALFLEAGDT